MKLEWLPDQALKRVAAHHNLADSEHHKALHTLIRRLPIWAHTPKERELEDDIYTRRRELEASRLEWILHISREELLRQLHSDSPRFYHPPGQGVTYRVQNTAQLFLKYGSEEPCQYCSRVGVPRVNHHWYHKENGECHNALICFACNSLLCAMGHILPPKEEQKRFIAYSWLQTYVELFECEDILKHTEELYRRKKYEWNRRIWWEFGRQIIDRAGELLNTLGVSKSFQITPEIPPPYNLNPPWGFRDWLAVSKALSTEDDRLYILRSSCG